MKSFREFIESAESAKIGVPETHWDTRRDLDIRPLYMLVGLNKDAVLTEVYLGGDFDTLLLPNEHHDKIQNLLRKEPSQEDSDIMLYTGNAAHHINNSIWVNHLHNTPYPDGHEEFINDIQRRLSGTTNLNGDAIHLYSGLPRSPVGLAGFEWNSTRKKKLLNLPAFTSSTSDPHVAANFTNVDVDSIHHESDHHGVILPNSRHILRMEFSGNIKDAMSVSHISKNPHEREVLLGRQHQFELNPRPTQYSGLVNPIYVWHATKGAFHTYKHKGN